MTDLVVVFGPPAVGKAAVGTALAALTGFRLFHNHMTAEPSAALFGWLTPAHMEATRHIRLALLSRALDQPDMGAVIFTFVWAFDLAEDNLFMAELVDLFEAKHRKVYFVELQASLEARIAREGTPLRLALKPAKHDVERARAMHREIEGKHRMNSGGDDFPYPERHMLVDTEACAPAEAAQLVCAHYGFPRTGG
jgi:hypothetical protein